MPSCLLISPVGADTVTLKDGTVYEGKVLREDGETLTLEINVTKSIKDERKIAKDEIKSIKKETALDREFEEIKGYAETPSGMPEEEYTKRIAALEKFIEKYPRTRNAQAAETMLATLVQERSTIRSGGLKVGDRLVSAEEYKANAFEVDAELLEGEIREQIEKGHLVEALRLFEKYEGQFGFAEAHRNLSGLILPVLRAYKIELERSLASIDRRISEREKGLESMAPENRVVTEAAIARENERLEARYDAEKESKMTWVTPDAFHKESLSSNVAEVESLVERLNKGPGGAKGGEEPLSEFYRVSHGRIGSGDSAEQEKVFVEARKRGLPEKYIEMLREHGAQ